MIEQETTINESKETQRHQEKDSFYNEEIQRLQQALEERVKANKKIEQNLRKKKLKTEKEVENWVHKYDQEMREKENEIKTLSVSSTT